MEDNSMKRKIILLGLYQFALFFIMSTFGGCVGLMNKSIMGKQIPSDLGSLSAKPGSNESILIVKRGDAFGESILIFLNDKQIGILRMEEEGRYIIPNGEHIISAEVNPKQKVKTIVYQAGKKEISAYSAQIMITATMTAQSGRIKFNMEEVIMPGVNRPNPNPNLDEPLNKAAKILMGSLTQRNSKIAILNISSTDPNQSEFIAGELEYILVSNKYSVVDRNDLDRIRQEQKLQLSGDVDDNSIVSIGKFTGANIVITGSITGEGSSRRLQLRALSTETAEVLAVSSESF
jgi:hypothetical protein